MKYLLDTHTLIWLLQGESSLPEKVVSLIRDRNSELFLSSVSIWEMGIKMSLGKLSVPYDLAQELPAILEKGGIELMDPDFRDFGALINLPPHHRDPFDRMLVVQSLNNQLSLISCDSIFKAYEVNCVW